jgi:hypothetical protein
MKSNTMHRRNARVLTRREMIPALFVYAPLWLLAPLAAFIAIV